MVNENYRVVREYSVSRLEGSVSRLMEEGWVPIGAHVYKPEVPSEEKEVGPAFSPSWISYGGSPEEYQQVMYRP